jgi:hypothetical protein
MERPVGDSRPGSPLATGSNVSHSKPTRKLVAVGEEGHVAPHDDPSMIEDPISISSEDEDAGESSEAELSRNQVKRQSAY